MFKQLSIIFLALVFFTACNNYLEKVDDTYPNNQPKKIAYYKVENNDTILVEEKEFYNEGQLKSYGKYSNKKRTGIWKYYFQNGKPWSEGEFKNGERHGLAKVYYETGKPRYIGNFTNGKRSGKWTFYNSKGEIAKEVNY